MRAFKFLKAGGRYYATGKEYGFEIFHSATSNRICIEIQKFDGEVWNVVPIHRMEFYINEHSFLLQPSTSSNMGVFECPIQYYGYVAAIKYIKKYFGFIPALEGINCEVGDESISI